MTVDTRAAMGSIIDLVTEFLRERRNGTIREIAAHYGLSEPSVRSVLYRRRGLEFVIVRKLKGKYKGHSEYVWAPIGFGAFDTVRFQKDYAKFKAGAAIMASTDFKTGDDDEIENAMNAQIELADLAPRMVEHIEAMMTMMNPLPNPDANERREASVCADCRP